MQKAVPVCLTIVVAGALFAAYFGFVEISLSKLQSGDIGTLLLTTIFVALVIERAVEVYANNRFDPEKDRIRLKLATLEANILSKQRGLDIELGRAEPNAMVSQDFRDVITNLQRKVLEEQDAIAPALAALKNRKREFAVALSTLLGLAAAVVTVRVLGQFLPTENGEIAGKIGKMLASPSAAVKSAAEFQLAALRFVDVILTTAVLAGGADGIHKIIKRFTDAQKT